MNASPYTDDFDQASECLRLALALLTRHRIPPSPFNFRLGYDAAAGKNETVREAFQQVIEQSDQPSAESLWQLYSQMFVQDDKALGAMRRELRRIIGSMQGQFEQSGTNLSAYTETLNRFAEMLDATDNRGVLADEVNKVIKDTRATEQSQQVLGQQLSQVVTEMSTLRNELEQVRKESLTDALTGVSNRKAFDTMLEQTLRTAREERSPFCVLLADIDHFKQFNDNHGHLVGDKVLRFVAATLKRCLKGKDFVARFGGEEFAVILPQTELNGALAVAEEIQRAVSAGRLRDKDSGEYYGCLTISLGVAEFRRDDRPNTLVQRADQALYLAKDRGRDRVEKIA